MSDYTELKAWLREHSSGVYRNSALAADVIEELQEQIQEMQGRTDYENGAHYASQAVKEKIDGMADAIEKRAAEDAKATKIIGMIKSEMEDLRSAVKDIMAEKERLYKETERLIAENSRLTREHSFPQ